MKKTSSISRRLAVAVALIGQLAMASAAGSAETRLTGHYNLRGVRETAAALDLSADGRFRFGISFGGVDAMAEGKWALRNGKVALTTDAKPEPSFSWADDQQAEATRCMSGYDGPGDRPVVLVACVLTPELGLVWSGVEVTGEFANGQQRSGATTRSGKLGFEARSEPEWAGVPITRLSVAYSKSGVPAQWFEVPPGAKTALIRFEPGRLVPPFFESAVLRIPGTARSSATLLMTSQDGHDMPEPLEFVRSGSSTLEPPAPRTTDTAKQARTGKAGSTASQPTPGKTHSLAIHGYNYTDRYIDSFEVNGQGGGNLSLSDPINGGGGGACCVSWTEGAKLPRKVTIKWTASYCTLTATTSAGEVFTRREPFWKIADVEFNGPVPNDPMNFEVHFYRDGKIEVAITAVASESRVKLDPADRYARKGTPRTDPPCPQDYDRLQASWNPIRVSAAGEAQP